MRIRIERDLRRIAALLRCAIDHLARGQVESARAAFAFAGLHLRHQMRFEEEVLYPSIVDRETARCLRCEHEVMRELQRKAEESLSRDELLAAEGDLRELHAELCAHQEFQRRVYPSTLAA